MSTKGVELSSRYTPLLPGGSRTRFGAAHDLRSRAFCSLIAPRFHGFSFCCMFCCFSLVSVCSDYGVCLSVGVATSSD